VILGNLSANGQVFVLNPNGVLFWPQCAGERRRIARLHPPDFDHRLSLPAAYTLTGNDHAGSVTNQGTLRARDGGYIALLGPQVVNEGVITARLGTAVLGAGNQVSLTIDGGSPAELSTSIAVSSNAFVSNKQLIKPMAER